ncbi:hypothetical protein AX17_004140 [Amanita inopinata Kibby_2008]|nr:hypothetical protein AX17_004140 [Amanita inopinata Kibby_2008]
MAVAMLQSAKASMSNPCHMASNQRLSNKSVSLVLPSSCPPKSVTALDISTSSASTTPEPSTNKPFQRLRTSLEQTLRTATRARKPAPADDITDISNISDKGKEKAKSSTEDASKDKGKSRMLHRLPSKVTFRRGAREVPVPIPIPPSGPVLQDRDGEKHEKVRLAGFTSFQTPSMRQASMSSPALHLSSSALPSSKSQVALPASSSTSAALASPQRERSKKADVSVSRREISTPLPLGSRREHRADTPDAHQGNTALSRERTARHRATKSNPPIIPPSPSTPSLPPKHTYVSRSKDRITMDRLDRDLPSPPVTPTTPSESRNHLPRSSSRTAAASSSQVTINASSSSPTTPTRAASPIRARPTTTRTRVVSPSRLSPASDTPSPSPRRSSVEQPRRVLVDAPRRGSLDGPSHPPQLPHYLRDDSPPPVRRRPNSPAQQSYAQNRHFNIVPGSFEHRELIRTATSMLCKEMIRPPPHMSKTEWGIKDWEEVERRMRALLRLERVWGKSGAIGTASSSNISASGPGSLSSAGEERERRLFGEALRDGFVLCQLINKLRSSSIVRPDSREDGLVRCSNVTKFLAACASYGLSEEDLFQPDDLTTASSESLARVARTIAALVNFVDSPLPDQSKYILGQGRKAGTAPISIPYQSSASRASASTPNLLHSPHSPSISPPSPTRRRWSPPSALPTVRSNSSEEDSSETTIRKGVDSNLDEDGDSSAVFVNSKSVPVPRLMAPPPRSSLRPRPARRTEDGGVSNLAKPHAVPVRLVVADFDHIPMDSIRNLTVEAQNARQSVASSAMTETTVTTVVSSILDNSHSGSGQNKFGTIRTVTTDFTSEAPSLSRTEGSYIADDMARKKLSDAGTKLPRDRKLSETPSADLTRVAEETDESVSSKGHMTSTNKNEKPRVKVVEKTCAVHLHKGAWPDDFMGVFNIAKPPQVAENAPWLNLENDMQASPSISASSQDKTLLSGVSRRSEGLEALPELPRRAHRSRHSVDNPILMPKESILRRDASPDGVPPVKVMVRRHSTKPNATQRNAIYIPRSGLDNHLSINDEDDDLTVPFPRAGLRDYGSGSATPITESAERPRFPRGRFQSDVEDSLAARRRMRPDEGRTRSRIESMVSLGVASSNASASDLLRRESIGGRRKTLVIKEVGKSPIQFQLGNCIGRGQFGSVYRALNLTTGQTVAIKQIRLEGLKEVEVEELMREVNLYKRLSHPGIVKYEGMARDDETLSIVLEYAENGSLGQTLKAFGKLNERLVASYVVKILEGLHYLHCEDVVHCDLKAANILTTKTGNVKLTDFGVSLNLRAMEREIKNVAGTPNWMAPEIIELKGASSKSDIWSLACTVVELLTGRPPYAEISNSMTVMFRIVEDDMPPMPEECSNLAREFLVQCFNKDPNKRPSAEVLFEHPWLKQNWGLHKELRPQDSIPFLRRVSADLQKNDVIRYLNQIEMTESPTTEGTSHPKDPVTGSPMERRLSTSPTRPSGESDFSPREHSFVKTTFSKPMRCRVCLTDVKKSAVICAQCSLISHSKCAPHAPPTCDLRAQLLLYAQYAEKGNPASVYHNPADALGSNRPLGAMSDVPYVTHSDPPPSSTPTHPPPVFRFMSAFKRSRSNLAAEPSASASASQAIDKVIRRKTAFHTRNKERPLSTTSNSTGVSSLRSAATAPESFSSEPGSRKSRMSNGSAEKGMPSVDIGLKSSRTRTTSGVSEAIMVESNGIPGTLPVETRKHKKRDSKANGSNCIVQ